ncbi:MAG: class I SAM-dependent methyltransferase, partial [Pseudomonadota bacterium]
LARAQARFAALGANPPEIIVADFAQTLPPGPFDAVVSALAIHHLEDDDKRRLFARIRKVLRPGGRFVNAEQVAGESPAEDLALDRAWEAEARSLGATDAMIEAARARMVHDRCATLAAQLDWLRAAGFAEVTTHWQGGRFATYSATRP